MSPEPSQWYDERFQNSSSIGYRIRERLHHSQSPFQKIEIFQTADFGKMLVLDGCIMLTEAHEFVYHELLVHIPLLSHPHPQSILVVGGGDGGTIREILLHDTVSHADMVEIDEEVVTVSRRYLPTLAGKLDDPRVRLVFRDAVEFVKDKDHVYDIVLVDSTDPVGIGEGLFSRAFYQNVLRSLKPGGIVAVQSESPFGVKGEVEAIVTKMKSVFPLVRLYWGPIPCYPHGTWSFVFCSRDNREPAVARPEAAQKIEAHAKYYNREVHRAAFALPNFMRRIAGLEP